MVWLPKKNVVVPIDFSDLSFAALDTALDLVDHAADVHVIHVLPLIEPAEPGVIWNTIDDKTRRHHAEGALRERLSEDKYADVSIEIAFGDPGHQIADFAQKRGAELIVIPSHGRSGLKRILIGSVAERVMRLAHCPLLILKP